jgi:hypothetical protein
MGHEEDYNSTNGNKAARGLTSASLIGAPLTSITWRLQGVRGGEDMIDPVRGPLSTGGLYGERVGWSLPGYPDGDWTPVTLPATDTTPGVSWYRTDVALDLPKGQDTSLGLTISDDPSGTDAVSDLPFLSATNGWGPVERDTSNGGQAAGDGHPIAINGVTYTKGLGTNSISDVEVYLGGHCTRFTAMVGVDDEKNGAGTVTFSVAADGKTLVTTPTIRGHQPTTPIDVDVTGAQVLDLIVSDAGDGNDHGDWAIPTVTCT